MKKVLPLAIGTFAFISIASFGRSPIGVNAAGNILYGDNVIPNATFSLGGGGVSEVRITGEAPRGWGDWSDFNEYFVKDPTNSTNVVLKYQAGGFPDCFGLISDITAGTEHPKPTIIGINAFPDSPILLISLSIKNATLAI